MCFGYSTRGAKANRRSQTHLAQQLRVHTQLSTNRPSQLHSRFEAARSELSGANQLGLSCCHCVCFSSCDKHSDILNHRATVWTVTTGLCADHVCELPWQLHDWVGAWDEVLTWLQTLATKVSYCLQCGYNLLSYFGDVEYDAHDLPLPTRFFARALLR